MTPGLNSSLYVGTVVHQRLRPKPHALRHRVFWLYLDLDELPHIEGRLRLLSINRRNIFSFWERNHGDGSNVALADQMRALLQRSGIEPHTVSIRLLCMPRTFGYDFNPLSVYFCIASDGQLAAAIYEVNNTFGGRHTYVIPVEQTQRGPAASGAVMQKCAKTFYVSPFMDMGLGYSFNIAPPGEKVAFSIRVSKSDKLIITASVNGARRQLEDRKLLQLGFTHPLVAQKVTGAIYWNALMLWLKGFGVNPAKPSRENTVSIIRSGD